MIPKELHLKNIIGTALEELARYRGASLDDWLLIERAAVGMGYADKWVYLRYLVIESDTRARLLRERWLKLGREQVLPDLWRKVIKAAHRDDGKARRVQLWMAELSKSAKAEGESIKQRVLMRDEQLARVAALQAVPCAYRPSDSIRSSDFLGYVVGRLAALRTFGGCLDWTCIDQAATKRGQSWLEFMAVELVRLAVKRAAVPGDSWSARLWRGRIVRLWRKWGEAVSLAGLWVEICHRARLSMEEKTDENLVLGGDDGMEKRKNLEPLFSAFVKRAAVPSVPEWLQG